MCGIFLSVGLPECEAPSEEQHDLLNRRGPDLHGTRIVRDLPIIKTRW